jgi:hypothetical protein
MIVVTISQPISLLVIIGMIEDDDDFDLGIISSPEVRAYKAVLRTIYSLRTQETATIMHELNQNFIKLKGCRRDIKKIN